MNSLEPFIRHELENQPGTAAAPQASSTRNAPPLGSMPLQPPAAPDTPGTQLTLSVLREGKAKPFDIKELEARLRSLLRRACGKTNPVLSCGALHYDTNSKQFSCAGTTLALTPREHAVLEALIRFPGKTVAKQDLVDSLFTLEDTVSVKALEIYIVRLRKKIENSGAKIITLRGLGYMLTYVAE